MANARAILGGALSGAGSAISENAVMAMKETAIRLRDENYMRLREGANIRSEGRADVRFESRKEDERTHKAGLLEASQEREDTQFDIAEGKDILERKEDRERAVADKAAGYQQQLDILDVDLEHKKKLLKIGAKYKKEAAAATSDLKRRKLFADSYAAYSKALTAANDDIFDPTKKLATDQIQEMATTFAGQVSGMAKKAPDAGGKATGAPTAEDVIARAREKIAGAAN